MTTVTAPASAPRLTDQVWRDWARLAAPTDRPSAFDPAAVTHLPEPARRWLNHAIRPGNPLLRSAELAMHGEIRLGTWRRFDATQVLAPPEGFIWAAATRLVGLRITGFDRHSSGTGEMRWRLLGVIPVVSATGADLTRSAAGRLASEFVLVPAVALAPEVTWEPVNDRQAIAHIAIDGESYPVTVTVAPSGALEAVTIPRWGNPDKGEYQEHIFGVEVRAEDTFDGFTIPSVVRGGWWYGTDRWPDGEFIRFTIDLATYR